MSSEWREQTLGECLLKIVDNRGKTPPLEAAETPYGVIEINAIVGSNKSPNLKAIRKFVSAETYNSWFRAGHPKPGDLLFSTVGSIAEVAMFDGKNCCIAQNIIGLRPNREIILPNYLYYALVSPAIQLKIRALDISSVQPSIKVPHLLATTIQVPPLELQEHIGTILSTLDDRIALLRETNATLEAIAQALFKSWFVDFDPVHAKARGEPPQGMDDATAALFPDSFEESELGMIPKGWCVAPLDQIANYLNGLALQKFPPDEDGWLPVIKIAQLRKGDTVDADRASCNIKPECIIQNGDVLFSWSGSLEVVIWCGGKGALNQHLFKVTSQDYPKWFYYLWTRQHLPNFQQIAASKATTMGHIQRKHLTEALTVTPSLEVMAAADSIFTPLLNRLINNSLKAQTLAQLRDTLLPKLISGQLRLPEAEALLAEEQP